MRLLVAAALLVGTASDSISAQDLDCYALRYPDLRGFARSQLQWHWRNFGKQEKRTMACPHGWNRSISAQDLDCYARRYPDLQELSSDKLWTHWVNFGKQEGRTMGCTGPQQRPECPELHGGVALKSGRLVPGFQLAENRAARTLPRRAADAVRRSTKSRGQTARFRGGNTVDAGSP